jgi:multiple sugar transport system substrate-binding protein
MWRFPLMDNQEAETKVWNDLIAGFTKDHPNVKITIETQPWDDRRQKLLSAIGSGRGPDVFYINPDMISQFSQSGAIVPLDDYVTPDDTAKFNPGTLIPWEGKLYALPILQNADVYIYNTDLVKQLGLDPNKLPSTVDELEQWAQVAKDKDIYFSTWSGNTATGGLTALIWQFGGEIYDKDGNVIIDSPKTVAALTFLKKMYDSGWIPPDSVTTGEKEQSDLFRNGKALSIVMDGNEFYGSRDTYVNNFNWAFGPVFKVEREVTSGTVGSYAVSSKASDPKLAAEWIKYVTDSANSVELNKTVGYLPPLKDVGSFYKDDPAFQTLLDRSSHVQVDPIFPSASQAYIILAEEQQAVMTGDKTPEQAAKDMQSRIEEAKNQSPK